MKTEQDEMVRDLFCEMLEKIAFMFGEAAGEDELAEGMSGSQIVSRINFGGALDGSFSMIAPLDMGVELAANMLGTDPDDDGAEKKASDACGELLNVVSGNLVTELAGDEVVVDLTPPDVGVVKSEECAKLIESLEMIPITVDSEHLVYLSCKAELASDSASSAEAQ